MYVVRTDLAVLQPPNWDPGLVGGRAGMLSEVPTTSCLTVPGGMAGSPEGLQRNSDFQ